MNRPIAVIIGGHPRSGTTLLNHVCNSHPDITTTFEFKSFVGIQSRSIRYLRLLSDPEKIKPILQQPNIHLKKNRLASEDFYIKFTQSIPTARNPVIQFADVYSAYRSLLPDVRVFGDKYPGYVFKLDKFANIPELRKVIIYRDPRDVAISTLEKAHNEWKGKSFSKKLNTADKIASNWVRAIAAMENHTGSIHRIKYEELIQDPETILSALAVYLDVDPAGFNYSEIRSSSVSRYRDALSPAEIQQIEIIAGQKMESLGYNK